ncbi:DUF1801 domain-containing protein [Herbiconiux daphne]|uniref:DUF1801 domain-containing protein n=1 Tax=Herbiconiux daphne TaxID=2970914 RepID=A0ABT2H4Z5_9MICO|nr:DUF1801 domain-containing protein [Herbiconiux daphne]MCS5734998.1 DUF1801 domain-containing protein [Herbiconiux daphne]
MTSAGSPWAGAASASVDAHLDALAHPRRAEIEALRAIILAAGAGADAGADTDTGAEPVARITESVKWNSPSYATARGDFATMNLRPTAVRVVLHTGAKADPGHPDVAIDDPSGLLSWLGHNRALVSFSTLADIDAGRDDFIAVLRQWIAQL